MTRLSGNDLLIATSVNGGERLMLTKEQRSRHLYVTGSTGSGKSKFLEHLIRQDIVKWRDSECGLLLLDPLLDVKTAFSCAIKTTPHHELIEFLTWPLLYQFWAAQPVPPGAYQGARVLVKPDGFVRIHEQPPEEDLFERFFFLEVDRSTESRETLARRAFGYQDFYHQGGLAVRYGATPEAYRDYPFRVLMVFLKSGATTWRNACCRMTHPS
jgi:hypothetical protein